MSVHAYLCCCKGCRSSVVATLSDFTLCTCHDAGNGTHIAPEWLTDPNGSHLLGLDLEFLGECYYPSVGGGANPIGQMAVRVYNDAGCTSLSFTSVPSLSLAVRIDAATQKITYAAIALSGGAGFVFLWTGSADYGDTLNNTITSCPAGPNTRKAYGGSLVITKA